MRIRIQQLKLMRIRIRILIQNPAQVEVFCDVTLAVEGFTLKCHKVHVCPPLSLRWRPSVM